MSGSGHASAASAGLVSYERPVLEVAFEGPREIVSESDDAESDVSQHSLPGPRRISDEEWLNYMRGDPDVRPRLFSDASIFRVPKFLKDTKSEAYVPHTVSLGPYHSKSEKLAPMDYHKGRALRRMMIRYNAKMKLFPDNMAFADNAMRVILSVKDKIRDIYEESIDCDDENLARMLCLDGCCILEVLRTLGRVPNDPDEGNDPYERYEPIFGEDKLAASNILKDIVMLENQIPWIVLLELLRLEYPEDDQVQTILLNLLVKATWGLFKIFDTKDLMQRLTHVENFHHVLGFLHKAIVGQPSFQDEHRISIERSYIGRCLLMLQDKNKAMNHDFESIPTAVELKNAGIKFQPCDGGIDGIRFDQKGAIIYLPVVSITYGTEVLFRNLISFEMCRPSEPNYVSSYLNLMDDLIDSQKDVALLRSTGILIKLIGSDKEVADRFNGLCEAVGTVSIENVFDGLRKDVNAHYKYNIGVQLEDIVQNHCSSRWKFSTFSAASVIACFGLITTIFIIRLV